MSDSTLEKRFWAKVNIAGPDECWEWQAGKCNYGYGKFHPPHYGPARRAHRISWELVNGPIPEGMRVLHRCDNPPCVNPAHLFLGTMADNTRDMLTKGREASGDRSGPRKHPERMARGNQLPQAKLTEQDIREIRAIYIPRMVSTRMLARKYGVSQQAIFHVLKNHTWKHIS